MTMKRNPMLLTAVVAMALLGACSDGDGGSPTTTSGPTTTATAAPETQAPGPSATSRPAGPQPTNPRTTTPSASLADGTHPAYLTGVDTGRRTITVDVVQVIDRTSAEAATVCPEIAKGDIDGYCIKNTNGQLRTVSVAQSASLQVLSGSSLRSVDLSGLAAARRPQKESSFFEVTVQAGKVTAAKELYRA